ncbi:crossover junction endodeoxyribonuclease RuvC [Candidatus Roizmanbacteria bacterium CG_4_10_14_0_2_um_filter_39_13]|uniref:Crossover junction endodeoxyribonuclease RuvC n=1 Tax=Candidatus Roizmanbacteria bacterium CG_4_10_14_0_2_um_filter_39_13 TaxID=1974825 RepID=A0A2M7TWX8_9BACT|nr:MAG: crossover junction endodeoxyribonuclease RuvC [Candidatus Roizmanbacteria bacterium CG_4_10_14_0_2_um_filter_39_13]
MKILSIDPGFEKVGWAIFDKTGTSNSDFTFITSDLIKTSKTTLHELRLRIIYDTLNKIIKKQKIEHLVIEKLFFFKNKKTVLEVSQAVGVIELAASNNAIPITRLTPLEIKQIITGYGTADKKSVQKMIRLELGDQIIFKDDDESDAIACGLAYIYINR